MDVSKVSGDHFAKALQEVRPSVTPEVERDYEDMLRTLRQENPQPTTYGFTALRQANK